jgi:Ca-activated chloride channel homolog
VWFTPETAQLDVLKDKDADQIEVIEQFTDTYFDLVRANTADENRLLGSQRPGEELLIQLRGKNYLLR